MYLFQVSVWRYGWGNGARTVTKLPPTPWITTNHKNLLKATKSLGFVSRFCSVVLSVGFMSHCGGNEIKKGLCGLPPAESASPAVSQHPMRKYE